MVGTPVKIDHESYMLESMPPMWKTKPIASGIIQAIGASYQPIEDTLFDILVNDLNLYTAVGVGLDRIGKILNEDRRGRFDEEYRTALIQKASVRGASGTTRDIKRISKAVTGATTCYVFSKYPACSYIWLNASVNSREAKVIEEAHMAGVRTRVMWCTDQYRVRTRPPSNIARIYAEAGDPFTECGGDYSECGGFISSGVPPENTGNIGFTSLVEGATSYEVVDTKGRMACLASPSTVSVDTGYLIDHDGNYIVDDNGNYIRYVG